MAAAVGREKPFTGELIRLYEEDINQPGTEARSALAKVFARSESYIEFGETRRQASAHSEAFELSPEEKNLIARYREADPRWRLSLRLLAALATEDQIEVATDVNVVIARIVGKKPKELRYASDKRAIIYLTRPMASGTIWSWRVYVERNQ